MGEAAEGRRQPGSKRWSPNPSPILPSHPGPLVSQLSESTTFGNSDTESQPPGLPTSPKWKECFLGLLSRAVLHPFPQKAALCAQVSPSWNAGVEGAEKGFHKLDPTTQRPRISFPLCPDLRFCRPPSRVGRNSSALEVQSLEPGQAQLCFHPTPQAAGGGSASPAGPGGGDATPGTPEGDAGHGGRFQQRSSAAPGPAGSPGNRVSEALAPGWEGLVDVPFY